MLTIFHAPRTRSLRVVWLCEEMGLPYEVKTETFGQPSAAFLAANPLGAFPAIKDGDLVMQESTAILQYLADTYGPTPLALTSGDARYCDYLQFLTFGEASLAAYMNPVIATQFMAPEGERQNATVEIAKGLFIRRLGVVEQALEKGEHLAGDFTAADISVGYALGLGEAFGLGERFPASVKAYAERLRARPAFQRASAK